jgi:hypothetical protein
VEDSCARRRQCPDGWAQPTGHWLNACSLELLCVLGVLGVLAGKEPGGLCGMAGMVDLLGAGGGGVTAEVLPAQAVGEEDRDRGAALAAHREGSSSSSSVVAALGFQAAYLLLRERQFEFK